MDGQTGTKVFKVCGSITQDIVLTIKHLSLEEADYVSVAQSLPLCWHQPSLNYSTLKFIAQYTGYLFFQLITSTSSLYLYFKSTVISLIQASSLMTLPTAIYTGFFPAITYPSYSYCLYVPFTTNLFLSTFSFLIPYPRLNVAFSVVTSFLSLTFIHSFDLVDSGWLTFHCYF